MTYDGETGARLFERLSDAAVQSDLAAAGFADGDAEFIALVRDNILVHVDQASWR